MQFSMGDIVVHRRTKKRYVINGHTGAKVRAFLWEGEPFDGRRVSDRAVAIWADLIERIGRRGEQS